MQQLWWNLVYRFGKTPWDTGITPPELRAVVESGQVPPGRALDLGCGTGTNVIYLARHGLEVVGVGNGLNNAVGSMNMWSNLHTPLVGQALRSNETGWQWG